MQLIFVFYPAQDRHCIIRRRLFNEHRLESAGERGIPLDIFLIFFDGRSAYRVKLPFGERRF